MFHLNRVLLVAIGLAFAAGIIAFKVEDNRPTDTEQIQAKQLKFKPGSLRPTVSMAEDPKMHTR